MMKYFDWSEDKNEQLRATRGVSFEDIVVAIEQGRLLAIIEHPIQHRHPSQKTFVVELFDYAYLVPFIEDHEKIFLKTIFPSRKYTKFFIEKGGV